MRFSRNLGLLTDTQQEQLHASKVVVSGVGGMGGVAAEALVRMGIGSLFILDHDKYEISNINRQIHCTDHAIGRKKVDVIGEKLLSINPSLKLSKCDSLNKHNVSEIISNADVVINGMDDIKASIILEREARRQGKTIVDAWITPYASVFVITPESPHWEEFLKFPTLTKAIDEITKADIEKCLRLEVMFTLSQFNPTEIISEQLIEEILSGKRSRPSLAPVVWLSGTLMANEAMKYLTKQGRLATHWGVFYNQYDHEIKYIDMWGKEEKSHANQFNHYKLAG